MIVNPNRRQFILAVGAAAITVAVPTALRARSAPVRGPHPVPRKGITAAKVATDKQLKDTPDLIPIFAGAREIPEVFDGIRCQCGCAELKDYYSLLSCFEAPAMMATHCEICQAQGRLVHRMHKAGKTLDEIRRGIDARFG